MQSPAACRLKKLKIERQGGWKEKQVYSECQYSERLANSCPKAASRFLDGSEGFIGTQEQRQGGVSQAGSGADIASWDLVCFKIMLSLDSRLTLSHHSLRLYVYSSVWVPEDEETALSRLGFC